MAINISIETYDHDLIKYQVVDSNGDTIKTIIEFTKEGTVEIRVSAPYINLGNIEDYLIKSKSIDWSIIRSVRSVDSYNPSNTDETTNLFNMIKSVLIDAFASGNIKGIQIPDTRLDLLHKIIFPLILSRCSEFVYRYFIREGK